MLKFEIGNAVVATKFKDGDNRRGPWKVVARHYDQTGKAEDRTYKVSRPSERGTESRHFREADLDHAK